MGKLRIVLEMIKFEHTIFALPFAFLGAFLAQGGVPEGETSLWIVAAMVGARSSAMAFNRLVDRRFDQLNPRTSSRALPRGLVTTRFVAAFIVFSSGVFFFSAWMLNSLAFLLSPLALGIVLAYSFSKRFTSLSHLVLGLSLAIAPVGGWIAVRGQLDWAPLYLGAAVLFWVAGFDIIYACQDYEFDRRLGLYSLPRSIGIRNSLWLSAAFHLLMVVLLFRAFLLFDLSYLSWSGLLLLAIGLMIEHSLVDENDLSRVNAAFFTVNGVISLLLFAFVGLDLCLFG